MSKEIPEYCDYHCPHAEFPPADTAGICRTMSAVWCNKLAALTNKNMPCAWRAAKDEGAGQKIRKTNAKPKTTKKRTAAKTGRKVSGSKRTTTGKRSVAKKRK